LASARSDSIPIPIMDSMHIIQSGVEPPHSKHPKRRRAAALQKRTSAMTDDLMRGRLTERIRRLSREKLLALERFVAQLESDGPPPVVQPSPTRDWPHAPVHRLSEHGTYLVTAGTLHKQHRFATVQRLDVFEAKLLELARHYEWQLEAWAVFSNHYHFIGHAQGASGSLRQFLGHLHTATAAFVNALDCAADRQVWHNFWETRLTFERSYLARLHYVHQNPVKHGLVRVASQYRWCSAAWFEGIATPAQVQTIYRFKIDRLRVFDDFDVLAPT
jgi:putative transposase